MRKVGQISKERMEKQEEREEKALARQDKVRYGEEE